MKKGIHPLTQKEIADFASRYARFIDSMPDNYKVLLGSFDWNVTLGQIALSTGLAHGYLQPRFMRHEMEALREYFILGTPQVDVEKKFLMALDPLKTKLREICGKLDVTVDKTVMQDII